MPTYAYIIRICAHEIVNANVPTSVPICLRVNELSSIFLCVNIHICKCHYFLIIAFCMITNYTLLVLEYHLVTLANNHQPAMNHYLPYYRWLSSPTTSS